MNKDRRIQQLENKIQYREAALADQRARVHGAADKKIEAATTDKQRAYWEEYRRSSLEAIDLREQAQIEPLRVEYRSLLGLDD